MLAADTGYFSTANMDACSAASLSSDLEPAAQEIPDRDAEVAGRLCQAEGSIPAVTVTIAPRPGPDLPPRDVTPSVVLGPVGVQRDLRPVQHH